MKAEVIREIARKQVLRDELRGVEAEYAWNELTDCLTRSLRILEQAGFVVVKTEELEAALKPFAKESERWNDGWPDECRMACTRTSTEVTIGDLRRAAAPFAALTQEGRG